MATSRPLVEVDRKPSEDRIIYSLVPAVPAGDSDTVAGPEERSDELQLLPSHERVCVGVGIVGDSNSDFGRKQVKCPTPVGHAWNTDHVSAQVPGGDRRLETPFGDEDLTAAGDPRLPVGYGDSR